MFRTTFFALCLVCVIGCGGAALSVDPTRGAVGQCGGDTPSGSVDVYDVIGPGCGPATRFSLKAGESSDHFDLGALSIKAISIGPGTQVVFADQQMLPAGACPPGATCLGMSAGDVPGRSTGTPAFVVASLWLAYSQADAAPTKAAPVVAPTACWVGLFPGQSAIEMVDSCVVLQPGDSLTLGPSDQFVHAWIGPHTRLCWADDMGTPIECVGNIAPVAIVFTAADVNGAASFSDSRHY